jgi:hypothetical protein
MKSGKCEVALKEPAKEQVTIDFAFATEGTKNAQRHRPTFLSR